MSYNQTMDGAPTSKLQDFQTMVAWVKDLPGGFGGFRPREKPWTLVHRIGWSQAYDRIIQAHELLSTSGHFHQEALDEMKDSAISLIGRVRSNKE